MSEPETIAPPAAETSAAAVAVDPQDEARLRGISKSIVVGLGGTGHKIVLVGVPKIASP